MSKHIDAYMVIRKYIDPDIKKFSNSDVKIVLENLKQNILKAPSIDIVRCKECKCHKYRADYKKEYCLQHSKVLYDTGGGCSWGKE